MFSFVVLSLIAIALGVKVQVMMPLTTVGSNGHLSNESQTRDWLKKLKDANVDSIMTDVWWGIAEPNPKSYNFQGWLDLAQICKDLGLKMSPVMSFHRCGGNVGDDCNIPLPTWVQNVAKSNDLYYKDQQGRQDPEVLSLSADYESLFSGRTALQMYEDFMEAFASKFSSYISSGVIYEVQVGLGPCGELRYPSYNTDGGWKFPGVGEFQCWDSRMLNSWRSYASSKGHSEWTSPPTDAGTYNSKPSDTTFFKDGGYNSQYGQTFLTWYSNSLINHGRDVLNVATGVFDRYGVPCVGKVAGIHWWYGTNEHGAELTAGYYNIKGRDGYYPIAQMMEDTGAGFDFTCFEMKDSEQDSASKCQPQELVQQIISSVRNAGGELAGENALERYDQTAYDTMTNNIRNAKDIMTAITYLRLTSSLVSGDNYNRFKSWVNTVHGI